MPSDRRPFVGRTAEAAALDAFAGTPSLLVVRGRAGIGRSAFLHELRRVWRERGITVLALPVTADEPPGDVFRAQAVIDLVRESFHEYVGPELAGSMAVLSRLSGEAGASAARAQDGVLAELVRLFRTLRATRPVAVFVDDVDTAPDPVRAIAAAHRAGCTVVVTCREDGGVTPLVSLADRVLDLGALRETEVGELLARVAPAPLDEAVIPAVRAALGPLAGHPGTVLATLDALRREDAFADVLGHLCLRGQESSVALPREHDLVRHVEELGEAGVQIVALAADAARLDVDDVLHASAALGHELRRCGDVVDRLVAVGALACDENGRLSVPCSALTAALMPRFGADRLRAAHRTMAEQLLRGGTADMSTVADHVALAGAALPADPALVPLLEREATRIVRADPSSAARWFRAALRHVEPGADHVRLLRIVLHLLVRTAQYPELAEVVGAEVAAGVPECCRYELAAAAALASVHIGQPLGADVHDVLAGDPRARVPLRFAARWFDGRDPVRATDVAAAFSGFRVNRLPDWEHDWEHDAAEAVDPVAVTDGRYDVVAMLRLVLGPCYGKPKSGPLGVYRRLLRDYAGGEWSRVVSGARRLELSGAPTAMHHVARLLAAEVHASSGDVRRATQWFGLVDENCPFTALRAWVDLGIAGPDRGWPAYDLVRRAVENGDDVGLSCLLLRLGFIENGLGNGAGLARAAGEARRWHERFGGTNLRAAELVLRGLSEKDHVVAAAAIALLRRTGNAAELMRTCLAMASLSDDPVPWYAEALEFAKRLGEGSMDLRIRETMRKVGVVLPRARVARDDFSDVELRIIELVGQGRTNRQIATTVRMSEKTVENYLTRLFVRTGCRSRLDLATASLEGRLTLSAT